MPPLPPPSPLDPHMAVKKVQRTVVVLSKYTGVSIREMTHYLDCELLKENGCNLSFPVSAFC